MIYKNGHKIKRISIDNKEIYKVYFNNKIVFERYYPVTAIVGTNVHQYIETDMKDFWTDDIDFEIAYATNWNSTCIFGCRPDKSYQEYALVQGNDLTLSLRKGGLTVNGTSPQYFSTTEVEKGKYTYNLLNCDRGDANDVRAYEIAKKHIITKKGDNVYHNGELMTRKTAYNDFFLTYLPIYFFKLNQVDFDTGDSANPNSPNANGTRYLYHAVFYKKGELYREYIPVLDEKGKPSLYEKVTNTFLYSATDSPLEYFQGKYGQVSCIHKCSNTNYIDTNIYPKDIGKWELRIQSNDPNAITTKVGMGSATNDFGLYFTNYSKTESGKTNYYYELHIGSQAIKTTIPFVSDSEIIITFDLINKTASIERNHQQTFVNIKKETYDIISDEILENLPTLTLGKINGKSSGINFRIYHSKIYDKEGTLIQKLKPRVNLELKQGCMYDELSKTPYSTGTISYI